MQTKILFVHALSPLHAGTGQSIGAVDLPIARDRATDLPYLPGSSLKGSLRDIVEASDKKAAEAVFGPPTDRAEEHSGAVLFNDCQLLFLPVRSIAGTFAWVTSPYLLARFIRDAKEAGIPIKEPAWTPNIKRCAILENSLLKVEIEGKDRVILEDLDLIPDTIPSSNFEDILFAENAPYKKLFKERFLIVHDDVMTFLARHGTDVVTRIKINDDTKTVERGALWTEENLPPETILYTPIISMPPKSCIFDEKTLFDVIKKATKNTIQLGGNATVGRGRCKLTLWEKK